MALRASFTFEYVAATRVVSMASSLRMRDLVVDVLSRSTMPQGSSCGTPVFIIDVKKNTMKIGNTIIVKKYIGL